MPPVLAAALARRPDVLHEQNAVMGRANRFLAGRATRIATGFPALGKADAAIRAKAVHTGNPVRPAVLAAAATPYPGLRRTGACALLVTGGSQGARVMSDVVPAAVAQLRRGAARARLRIVQQARGEDEARVRAAYAAARRHGRGRAASSRICRPASPPRISSSPAPAPRRSANSP